MTKNNLKAMFGPEEKRRVFYFDFDDRPPLLSFHEVEEEYLPNDGKMF